MFLGIHYLLKDKGIFVFEIGYFGDLVSKNIYDTIYHEHLDYHSKVPLTNYLIEKGFSVKKISQNEVQGGTVRFYFYKENKQKIYPNVVKVLSQDDYLFTKYKISLWIKHIKKILMKLEKVFYLPPNKACIFGDMELQLKLL